MRRFFLVWAIISAVLVSCGGDVNTVEQRDPLTRLWIPVEANSVDLDFSDVLFSVIDSPVNFYDVGRNNIRCSCKGFFTGDPYKGVFDLDCPTTCDPTYQFFTTDNGTYEVSEDSLLTVCVAPNRPDLCRVYK